MIRVFTKTVVPVMDIIELQGKIVITEEALSAARDAKERRRASRREPRRSGATNSGTALGEGTSGTDIGLLSLSTGSGSSSSCCSDSTSDEEDGECSAHATAGASGDADFAMRRHGAADSLCGPASALRGPSSTTGASPAAPPSRGPNSFFASRRATVVEVPLGHVVQDRLNGHRCTLCIDTLRVHGSRFSFKHPWLVLRECTPARMRKLRRQMARTQVVRDDPHARELLTAGNGEGGGVPVAEPADDAASSSSVAPEVTMLFSEWLHQHPDMLSLNSLFLDDFDTGDKDDARARGPTAANPTCGASKSASSESTPRSVRALKRPREAENDGDTALDCRSFSSHSPASTSNISSAATVYKNYEIVGVVRSAVLFNSKPERVFQ
ncbi:hypothetical protein Q4I30_001151 [Leishmania utingensis]|uniref:Uncharacterized protein n=1 Tax=Leishmania utingensis TaxID=653362 RepID=A0AAW3AYK2_9TRYP